MRRRRRRENNKNEEEEEEEEGKQKMRRRIIRQDSLPWVFPVELILLIGFVIPRDLEKR